MDLKEKSPEQIRQAYRPDIDGLRAIAVLIVVAYHAFPARVGGGFVGVDIFFVISGYLITTIIICDLAQQKFSLADFYVRRVKRIFPSLALVLLSGLGAGWFLLLNDEYVQLGKHVAAGATFLSNFILLREGGYFDVAAELKPMLHLWSLAVEEHFYLVWPLLMSLAWKRTRTLPAIVIAAIAGLSFLLNVWLIDASPAHAFYISVTRFWELMLGSALAFVATGPSVSIDLLLVKARTWWDSFLLAPHRGAIRNGASVAGGLLIVGAVIGLDKALAYPGWWALVPTLAACLLIASGPDAWLNRVVLSNRLMISVGLISYPLYLWHWPVFYFLRVAGNGEPSDAAKWIAVASSLFLAWMTFNYVERPIRQSNKDMGMKVAAALCLGMGLVFLVGAAAYKNLISTRFPEVWQNIAWARQDRSAPRSWDTDRRLKVYTLGDSEKPEVLFFGDSHMETYYPRVKKVIEELGSIERGAVFAAAGGCPPIPNVERIDARQPIGCTDFFKQTIDYATKNKIRKIVLGAYWDGYFLGLRHGSVQGPALYSASDTKRTPIRLGTREFDEMLQALGRELAPLIEAGTSVYVLLPGPASMSFDPNNTLRQLDRLQLGQLPEPRATSIDRVVVDQYLAPVTTALRRLGQGSITFVNPVEHICDALTCSNMQDGQPIYTDDNHLTARFTREYGAYLDSVFAFH